MSIANLTTVHLNSQTRCGSTFYPTCAREMDVLDAKSHWGGSSDLLAYSQSTIVHARFDTYSSFLNTFDMILGEFPNFYGRVVLE